MARPIKNPVRTDSPLRRILIMHNNRKMCLCIKHLVPVHQISNMD